jgi:hypothetical protein
MILKESGITGKMWDLLKENSRKMRIRVLHPSITADSEVNVLRGLQEGSRLSPILFAIFAADLIRDLELQFPEITMPTASALTWMGTIFYVDDAVLIARSPEELQLMLNVCQQWAEKNRMSINVNKTKIVVFLEDSVTRNARQRFNFMMILLLLFLQKQSLAFAVYLFGIGTLHTGPGLKKKNTGDNALTMTSPVHW